MTLLSIIIPTRNRGARLANLLDSMAALDPAPFPWEVVVVDNDSSDHTREIVRQKASTLPIGIRYEFEPQLGLHYGRHRGASAARGNFLGFLDDDMVLAPQWLKGVELLRHRQAEAVVGKILPRWEAPPPEWLTALWTHDDQGSCLSFLGLLDLGDVIKEVEPRFVLGGNCFIEKKRLLDLKGFNPDGMPEHLLRYRGDGETGLMMKFKSRGWRSYYDPRATVYHIIDASRLTVEYLCRRSYNQGISDSFTFFRQAHGLVPKPTVDPSWKSRWLHLKKMPPDEIFKAVARKIKTWFAPDEPDPYNQIKQNIASAYQAGWQFHQSETARDPNLKKYILRENYLD